MHLSRRLKFPRTRKKLRKRVETIPKVEMRSLRVMIPAKVERRRSSELLEQLLHVKVVNRIVFCEHARIRLIFISLSLAQFCSWAGGTKRV